MQPDLAVFPVPMLTFLLSAVAAGLVLRADLGRVVATRFFAAFFLVLALGSFRAISKGTPEMTAVLPDSTPLRASRRIRLH